MPNYYHQKFYYGKATVFEYVDNDGALAILLKSYNTIVLAIIDGELYDTWGGYTNTTGRHIAEFTYKFTDRAYGKKDIDALPYKSVTVDYNNRIHFNE